MATRRAPGRPRGRPAKTRQEIVEAGAGVFRRLGYHQARMDDVAAALGLSKGSLYYYVHTKEDLLFEIVLPPYREAIAHLTEVAASDLPVPARLEEVIRRHLSNVVKHYPAISIYLESHRHLPVPEEMRQLDREYSARLRQIVIDGMRDGSLRIQDPATAVAALVGMCNWFAIRYEPAGGWDPVEVAAGFAAIFLEGLVVPHPERRPRG
ncbi:MAG: TetR/AcrR family transcriptional regulator [Acidimicrobiia bacterium]|nr:TetR/AcrR family transcriptional regulator [Acidimicrobiia bacterium]